MTDLNPIARPYDDLLLRPCVVLAVSMMLVLSIINALAPYNSMPLGKGLLVLGFTGSLFLLSLQSLRYFLYMYIGGAVIQGLTFLVPPTATEQKYFFSYFYLMFGSLKVYFTDYFLLIAACIIPLQLLMHRDPSFCSKKKWHALNVCVAIFISYGVIMALLSVSSFGKSALGESRTILFAGLFFVAFLVFTSRIEILTFLRFFVFVTIVRTFVNTLTVILSPVYLSYQRPFGSNSDAAYCAISLLLLIVLQENLIDNILARRVSQFWLGIFPILITSRSTILCLLITLLCYVIVTKTVSLKKALIWLAIATMIAVVCIYIILSITALNDLFGFRFVSLFQRYQDDPTGNWRLLGWLFALESIMAHPFIGVGFGGYAERFINGEWLKVSLHSAYLDYLYCTGLVGLSIFVTIIAIGITATIKKYNNLVEGIDRRLILSVFLVLCYLALFIALNAEMSYALTGTIMWIFLGMVPFLCKEDACSSEVHNDQKEG